MVSWWMTARRGSLRRERPWAVLLRRGSVPAAVAAEVVVAGQTDSVELLVSRRTETLLASGQTDWPSERLVLGQKEMEPLAGQGLQTDCLEELVAVRMG
jgi:hypothetical protein